MTFLAYRSGLQAEDARLGVSSEGVGIGRGKGELTLFTRTSTRVLFHRPAQSIPLVRTPARFILGGQPPAYRDRRSGGGGHGRDEKKSPRKFPVVLAPAARPVSVDPARVDASPPSEGTRHQTQRAIPRADQSDPPRMAAAHRTKVMGRERQVARPEIPRETPERRQRREEEELIRVLIELYRR